MPAIPIFLIICSKVVDFKPPNELMATLDLELSDKGANDDVLLQACKDTIKYSVKTGRGLLQLN